MSRRVAEGLLVAAVVVLPACLGGAPEWTAWVLCILSSSALVAWLLGAAQEQRRFGRHLALWLPLGLCAVALVQLVPLPPSLLQWLSPSQAALREDTLVPLGLTAWRPLTADVPSTLKALVRLASLGALFFVSRELGRDEGVRRRLFAALALAGGATAACGFLHLLAGAQELFGVYRFYGVVPLLTPFGNTNHLASWLTLTGTVALALAMKPRTRDAAVAWALVALLCAAAVFFSFSRGGIAVFIGTWGLVAVSAIARRSGGMRGSVPWLFIVGALLLAGFLSFEQLLERAETISSVEKLKATKVHLWPMFAQGLTPYWPVGMGAGAFELAFAPAQTVELITTFTHPEVLPLQWVADFGAPVTLAAAALVLVLGWRLWRVTRVHVTENVALLALLGVAVHDVFDFALELNAVAPAAAIVAGLLCALDERGARRPVRRFAVPVAGAVTALGLAALSYALPGFHAAERELREEKAPFSEVRERAVRAIDRHPNDWVLYSTVAWAATREADAREALAWINRVLLLRPHDAHNHLAAARALWRLGAHAQALGEYCQAWRAGDETSLGAGLALAAQLDAWERVLLPIPGHLTRAYELLLRRGEAAQVQQLLDAALLFPPSDEVAQEARVLAARHAVDHGAAEEALRLLDEGGQAGDEAVLVRARALAKLQRVDEAAQALQALLTREPANTAAAFALMALHAQQGRYATAREVAQRLRPFVSGNAPRAALFAHEAALFTQEGRHAAALDALETAARIEPGNAAHRYGMARAYEALENPRAALAALRQARALDSDEGKKASESWLLRLEAPP